MRDDFDARTKQTLAKRVGHSCSRPGCGQQTCGPNTDPHKAVNVGVAAHIRAAAPGGSRYDSSMTSAERASISNGIWLCQTCAKLVDDDPGRYTVDFLREWKASAEAHADAAVLGLPLSANESSSSNGPGAGELMTVSVDGVIYSEINRAVFVPASIWNESDRANSIRSVSLTIEGRSYSASKGRGTIAVGDYSWLSPHGLRVGAWASVRGCWYFGESLDSRTK